MTKNKKTIRILLMLIILLIGFAGSAYATSEDKTTENKSNSEITESIPQNIRNGDLTKNSKYPFYDECNVLSEETKDMILKINKNFEKDGTQIGVVILKSLDGTSIEKKANSVFNTWGLGKKEKNNGALLLISISDRQFRLEVGDGLRNTVLSDYEAKNIIGKMVPYFKQEAYNLGVNVALFEIDQKFGEYSGENINKDTKSSTNEIQEIAGLFGKEVTDDDIDFIVAIVAAIMILIIIIIMILGIVVPKRADRRLEKQKEKEKQERIIKFGKMHSFEIKITDQHGNTVTEQYEDYSKKDVDEDEIMNEIKDLVLDQESFGEDVVDYTIDEIQPNLYSVRYKDLSTIDVKIKTINEEDVFENDPERVKATKDFYNKLSPEERDFYKLRAKSNMTSDDGNNIWFYLYLYMLLQSDRSNDFKTSMSKSNIKGDNFYTPPTNVSHRSSSYSNSNSSSSYDHSSSSSFGGFGGGFSSGGGASGGW